MTLLAAAAIPASIQTSAALAATDTVANGGDSGAGSLRSVIASASSGDTIRFASRVHTVTVSSPIHINKNLTIDGAAGGIPTIDGGNRSRIFTIIGGHVSIFGLTLTRGKDPLAGGAIDDTSPGSLSVLSSMFVNNAAGAAELTQRIGGGAIFYGGSGRLSVDDSTFTGNTAGGPDPDLTGGLLGGSGDRGFSGFGGAIAINPTSASASINGSTFTHDAAGGPSDCPGGNGYGGAIFFYGNGAVTVRGDRFDGDTAGGRGCPDAGGDSGFGGAIWEGNTPLIIANSEEDHPNTSGSLSVSSSTFHQNHAGGHGSGAQTGHGRGGAIGVYANGPISVSTSTFNGNGAGGPAGGFGSTNSGEGEGGAIWQLGGTLSTSNSTLTRNSAGGTSAAGQGGAIFALIPTTLASDTIDANAVGSEDIFGAPNAGSGIDARPVTAIATIISGNTGTTNCAERVASSKYSFEGPAGSTTCGLDLPSVDPGLRALADNGGPTQTQALPPTGPAVDRVPVSICPAHSDQRGLPRPDGRETMCDVGAYEHRDPKAVPAMTTSPPASAVRTGHALHDTARLTGGNAPTGTVTFKLYASARCSGDPVFTSTNRVARLATSSGNFRRGGPRPTSGRPTTTVMTRTQPSCRVAARRR